MNITGKYVNESTGEIVGYRLSENFYNVPVSEEVVSEYDEDEASYLQYIDCEVIPCLVKGVNIYLSENSLEENEDMPDHIDGSIVWIGGKKFDRFSGFSLDNKTALNRMLLGTEV